MGMGGFKGSSRRHGEPRFSTDSRRRIVGGRITGAPGNTQVRLFTKGAPKRPRAIGDTPKSGGDAGGYWRFADIGIGKGGSFL